MKSVFEARFWTLATLPFLTDFSLFYIHGDAIESSFRISKSYVGIAMAANKKKKILM